MVHAISKDKLKSDVIFKFMQWKVWALVTSILSIWHGILLLKPGLIHIISHFAINQRFFL